MRCREALEGRVRRASLGKCDLELDPRRTKELVEGREGNQFQSNRNSVTKTLGACSSETHLYGAAGTGRGRLMIVLSSI